MLPGYATPEGTSRYAGRFDHLAKGHFRWSGAMTLSSIGLGTYLGEPDDRTDASYRDALLRAFELGCNVIDTAVNYRCQRSERVVGAAIASAVSDGTIARDEVFVSTKGGFIPFDGEPPGDPQGYFYQRFVESGVMGADDLVAGCHCMTPQYLEHQVSTSRRNLGLETIDLYYIHNPETQLGVIDHESVYSRLKEAFAALEEMANRGWLRRYGIATWEGLRAPEDQRPYLSMAVLAGLAREVGGEKNRLRAVQLPVNLNMPEAFARPNQPLNGETLPALAAAQRLGWMSFASGTLHQGQLLGRLPPWLCDNLGSDLSDAQRALHFTRSCPGLSAALVGMSQADHVEENLELAQQTPLDLDELRQALQPPTART